MPETILAFDFGLKYIGVAVGQTLTKTASPVTTLRAHQGIPQWEEIEKLILQWRPRALVVGVPLNMDGTEQPMTSYARQFIDVLEKKFNLTVFPVDERLSTWEAKNRLFESSKSKKAKKNLQQIDAIAASILLEQWLKEL